MLKLKIQKAVDISPSVKLYTLLSKATGVAFSPGQYISFFISTKKGRAIRPYSICSLPSHLPKVELCVKQVLNGVGTGYLLENIGNEVESLEPQGDFTLPESSDRPLVFIAAGVGVAPVRSQIPFWLDKFPTSPTSLIYRFRRSKECLFKNEFEHLSKVKENFTFVKSDSLKEKDFEEVLKKHLKHNLSQLFYIVGPPSFVKQVTETLSSLGYSDSDVVLDIWE